MLLLFTDTQQEHADVAPPQSNNTEQESNEKNRLKRQISAKFSSVISAKRIRTLNIWTTETNNATNVREESCNTDINKAAVKRSLKQNGERQNTYTDELRMVTLAKNSCAGYLRNKTFSNHDVTKVTVNLNPELTGELQAKKEFREKILSEDRYLKCFPNKTCNNPDKTRAEIQLGHEKGREPQTTEASTTVITSDITNPDESGEPGNRKDLNLQKWTQISNPGEVPEINVFDTQTTLLGDDQMECLNKKDYSFDRAVRVVVGLIPDHGSELRNKKQSSNFLSNNSYFEDIKNLSTAVRDIISEYTKERSEKIIAISVNIRKVDFGEDRWKSGQVSNSVKIGVAINEGKFEFKKEICNKIEMSSYTKIIPDSVKHIKESEKGLIERAKEKKQGFEKIKSSEITAAERKTSLRESASSFAMNKKSM